MPKSYTYRGREWYTARPVGDAKFYVDTCRMTPDCKAPSHIVEDTSQSARRECNSVKIAISRVLPGF